MIVHDRIAAGRPSSAAASVRTYPHGRICRQDACATVLSAYNSSPFCALHERASPHPTRAWRPAVERTCEALRRRLRDGEREAPLLQRPLPDGGVRAAQARRCGKGK